ncbi:MAG: hypothetical protein OEN55_01460 [Alphaproteobacteria bacterium]|nr:hypothetical protein [Alphaproteobacteria bacterium]
MAGANEFVFELDEEFSEGDLVAMTVTTPSGKRVHIWAAVELAGRNVILRQFSIYGVDANPGELGLVVLRDMAQAAMEVFDVDFIRIEDARRTSGAGAGRAVGPIEFRRRKT